MKKWHSWLGFILFITSLWLLHAEFQAHHLREILNDFRAIPVLSLFAALFLTFLDFFFLSLCETLSFGYIKKPLPYSKISLSSFVSYAFSNSVGFAGLSGASVRFRFYSVWGLSASEVAKLAAYVNLTFVLGFLGLAGFCFLFEPVAIPQMLKLTPVTARVFGILFWIAVTSFLCLTVVFKKKIRIKNWEFRFPSWRLTVAQLALTAIDLTIAAAVLYVLFPATARLNFPHFLTAYLLAMLAGLVSQVPGGLGVFETMMILLCRGTTSKTEMMGAFVAYRMIYYLMPLCLAALFLGFYELYQRREKLQDLTDFFSQMASVIIPRLFSVLVFFAGLLLLFSGATPGMVERIIFLKSIFPLPVLEISHFLGSMIGACLLILAWGLARRMDAAYFSTLILLGLGGVFSLIKGFDFEEALILFGMAFIFVPTHRHFYRKTSLLHEPISRGWLLTFFVSAGTSLWLGFFSFKHVNYSHDLWWQFSFDADAPRFLRATAGSFAVIFLFAFKRFYRPMKISLQDPTEMDLSQARSIIEKSKITSSNLALLGDKAFFWNEARTAFIMYRVQGRTWVGLGDPVGPEEEAKELIWRFHECADEHGGITVFYDVPKESIHTYLDLGLIPLKFGEEARVPLRDFSLEGAKRKGLRHGFRHFEKQGCAFEVVPPSAVGSLMPQLRAVSDSWLSHKNTREKGFSLGFFNEEYLRRYSVAVIRKGSEIVGFANLWMSGGKEELSVDLMRYRIDESLRGIMDYLFLQLMMWGSSQGFQWFNLGIAPLSGLSDHALAPLWVRMGSFLFRHGEHFYHFQGLRHYKNKFDPIWEPKYLLSPAGLHLPRIMTDLAALISGGIKGIITK